MPCCHIRTTRNGLLCLLVTGCAWWGGTELPLWLAGSDPRFPASQFIVGMGEGKSASQAEERAYAAVAKVFQVKIEGLTRDRESYVLREGSRGDTSKRELSIDYVTQARTSKTLENVRVLDRWVNLEHGMYYVLAGLDRVQAEHVLTDHIMRLDGTIREHVETARASPDKLVRLARLRGAIQQLVQREAHDADLRIVRISGAGLPSQFTVAELSRELRQFLSDSFRVKVEVSGDYADAIKVALVDGITKQGFRVIGDPRADAPPGDAGDKSSGIEADVLIRGGGFLQELHLPDPLFTYVRWCGEFRVVEPSTKRVLGIATAMGREGHVTKPSATVKALEALKRTLSSRISQVLIESMSGERGDPTQTSVSSCERDPALSP